MKNKKPPLIIFTLFTSVIILAFGIVGDHEIPKLWDINKLKSGYLPLVDRSIEIQPIPAEVYYKIPERVAYKTYPLYKPGREPRGYSRHQTIRLFRDDSRARINLNS